MYGQYHCSLMKTHYEFVYVAIKRLFNLLIESNIALVYYYVDLSYPGPISHTGLDLDIHEYGCVCFL